MTDTQISMTFQTRKAGQPGLDAFAERFTNSVNVQQLVSRARASEGAGRFALSVSGLVGSARAFLLNTLVSELNKPLLYICAQPEDGFSLAQDLEFLPCAKETHHFPSLGVHPYDFSAPSGEMLGRRISALAAMKNKSAGVYIASLKA
ncbi:hypothetical protein JYU19_02060, partial [bacterium AH-315-J21]|nr:hypothetical protein [bacterium AH-315-J21]